MEPLLPLPLPLPLFLIFFFDLMGMTEGIVVGVTEGANEIVEFQSVECT
jgi:hypothetical protein